MFSRSAFWSSALIVILFASSASASVLRIGIGGDELSRSGRWINEEALVLTFDDSFGPNLVRLTIDFDGGTGVDLAAFVDDLVFNVDDSLTIDSFNFLSGLSDVEASVIDYVANDTDLPPEEGFDIKFAFGNSNQDRFNVGETSVYELVGTGLTASSFNFTNDDGIVAYTHINAYENGDSGKFEGSVTHAPNAPVPEPGASLIWISLLGMAGAFRKRR